MVPRLGIMGRNRFVSTTAVAIAMVHTLIGWSTVWADSPKVMINGQFNRSSSATGPESPADALKSCYNAKFKPNPTPFLDFINDRPSQSLYVHRVWWSKRKSQYPFTSFTSLDVSRLRMLEGQCHSFPGVVISAGVWQPMTEPEPVGRDANGAPQLSASNTELLLNVTNRLEEFFQQIEAGVASTGSGGFGSFQFGPCILRLMLVVELVADEQMASIMPINAIRNIAFLAVDTPMATMVDVDLSISGSMVHKVLNNQTRMDEMGWRAQWEHVAWVMPTFDVHKNVSRLEKSAVVEEALAVPPEQKTTTLRSMWLDKHRIHPFAADRYALGHNATDYMKWFSTLDEYPSGFQEGYEPWFMGPRRAMPPYDVRIRGRYYDKITNVRYAMKLLSFMVSPDIWLVHRPHGYSTSHLNYRQTHRERSWALDKLFEFNGTVSTAADLYLKTDYRLFWDVIRRTNSNTYDGMSDQNWYHCRTKLTWWRGSFTLGPALNTTL